MTAHYSDSQPANAHAARRRSSCVNTAAVPFHADYLRHLRVGIKSSHGPSAWGNAPALHLRRGAKGFDASNITSKLAGRAHEALHDAEGHAQSLLDRGEAEVGKRLKGNGLYMSGNGNYQAGSFDGGGLYMSGNGFATSAYGTPGIPKGAYRVSAAHHLGAHPQVAAGGY